MPAERQVVDWAEGIQGLWCLEENPHLRMGANGMQGKRVHDGKMM